ncbi:MAG: FMN-binding negative transcriptional regulator [Pseudomonadota bacterium]
MHPSKAFFCDDRAALLELVEAYPFALVAGAAGTGVRFAHTPVLIEARGSDTPCTPVSLTFHLARANPLAGTILDTGRASLVFTGPHGYISPDWYGLGEGQVPTWNYVSVEAHGSATRLGEGAVDDFLSQLSATFEAPLAPQMAWAPDRLTPEAYARLRTGIYAFRLTATTFEGVLKLGQNKTAAARRAVIEALGDTPLAAVMQKGLSHG